MKKRLLLLFVLGLLTGQLAAQRLTGKKHFSNTGVQSNGAGRYTDVNWAIGYSFELKGEQVLMIWSDPTVTVAPASYYNYIGKNYSKADLGFSSWPETNQKPYNLRVTIQVSNGEKNFTVSSDCGGDGNCKPALVTYTHGLKNVDVSKFKVVSVTDMWYNGGGNEEVNKRIAARNNGTDNKKATEPAKDASSTTTTGQGDIKTPGTKQPNPGADFAARQEAAHLKAEAYARKIETKVNAMQQSFYAAESVAASKRNLGKLVKLDGDYDSVEQLETEFRQKYNAINSEIQTLTASRNEVLRSTKDFFVANANANTQAIGETVALLGTLFNEGRARREEARAKEELERRRAEEIARIEAKKLALLVALRRKLLTQFPDGGVPLSYHKIATDKLYFFAYVFNRRDINNAAPDIAVSNVFMIQRAKDGSWMFKSSITNAIKRLEENGNIVLSGYYTSTELAEKMRNTFLNFTGSSGMRKRDFVYQPQLVEQNKEEDDIWGTSTRTAAKNTTFNPTENAIYLDIAGRYNDVEETDSTLFYTPVYFDKLSEVEKAAAKFLTNYKNVPEDITLEVYRMRENAAGMKKKLATASEIAIQRYLTYLNHVGTQIKNAATDPLSKFGGFDEIWKPGQTLAAIKTGISGKGDPGLLPGLENSSPLAQDYVHIGALNNRYAYLPAASVAQFDGGVVYTLPAIPPIAHSFTQKEQQNWETDFVIQQDLTIERYRYGQSVATNARKGMLSASLENAYFVGKERKIVALRYNAAANDAYNVIAVLTQLFGKPLNSYVYDDYTKNVIQWSNGRYLISATLHQGSGSNKWTDLFIEDLQVMTESGAHYFGTSLDAYRLYNGERKHKYDGGLLPEKVELTRLNDKSLLRIKELPSESPLYIAGVRPGDIITSLDGFPVYSYLSYAALWHTGDPGEKTIVLYRNNQPLTLKIK